MSRFEKIIVPLIDDCIRSIDLTDAAGFIDSYTYDPDNPSGEKEFFLVYDDSKRNDFTRDRAIRFEMSRNIKKKYVKYVNGTPYFIYSFWVKPEIQKLYNGVLCLNTKQKCSILQFWSIFDDIVNYVMSKQVISTSVEHDMPLADYNEDSLNSEPFIVYKKGAVSNEIVPFFILF